MFLLGATKLGVAKLEAKDSTIKHLEGLKGLNETVGEVLRIISPRKIQ